VPLVVSLTPASSLSRFSPGTAGCLGTLGAQLGPRDGDGVFASDQWAR